MSAWLFDLGNSRLKCAPLLQGGCPGEVVVVGHDGVTLDRDGLGRLPARFDVAYVASVAPADLKLALLGALSTRCRLILQATTVPAWDGVHIAYARPRRLGVDRFLSLLGARARGAHPWLIVGVGTALTVDLIDAGGRHHGGRIAPSPTLMRDALQRRAVQLPAEGGRYVAFADDTDDALMSGCLGAAIGLIELSARVAGKSLGVAPRLVLHGGGAEPLLPWLADAVYAPSLVLEGLACWART